jgi:hypothetical protein
MVTNVMPDCSEWDETLTLKCTKMEPGFHLWISICGFDAIVPGKCPYTNSSRYPAR